MYSFYCRSYQFAFRLASAFLPWRRPEQLHGLSALTGLMKEKQVGRVLLVTDEGLASLGMHRRIARAVKKAGTAVTLYDKTIPNPTVQNIEDALALYKRDGCSAIVALGGGSPMDCAKGVGARVARPNKSVRQMRGQLKILRSIPMLVAIPTTAGSGSETTLAAVVVDSDTREKYAVNDPALIPHYVAFEPKLTVKLPKFITATTGMDALCHAVEAYIGQSNTGQTRRDALKAVGLIFENLYEAYVNGRNLTARRKMQTAAFLAGAAFTRAYVGNIHAISHTLSGMYGTPHGLANAVIMPYVLEKYGSVIDRRLKALSRAAGLDSAPEFIPAVREMNASMGIPETIPELKHRDIPLLVKRALKEANPLYPVPVIFGREEMSEIFHRILRK